MGETLKMKADVFLRMEAELHRVQKVNAALLEIAKTAQCPCVNDRTCGWCKKRNEAIAQAEGKS